MKRLQLATFTTFAVVIVVMAITSLLDALTGRAGTSQSVYSSWPFTLLWALLALLGMVYILRQRLWRQPATFLIHVSLFVILCGALATRLFGAYGSIHIRTEKATDAFVTSGGDFETMPFSLQLDTFHVAYYEGTSAPSDFISRVRIIDGEEGRIADGEGGRTGQASMNHILSYRHYRFYQAGYDPDLRGSRLSVAFDPFGIAITYTGYALLLLGMVLFFFGRHTRFRSLITRQTTIIVALLLLTPLSSQAKNTPKVIPTDLAEEFSQLYMSYNGRICPVETYAHDFCVKLCGKATYRHREASEVLCGWLFFPDTWKPEEMIKLKGHEVKRLLGTEKTFVAVTSFANKLGEYRLKEVMDRIYMGEKVSDATNIRAVDEKINILNSLFVGSSLKLFPVRGEHGEVEWYSAVDPLPQDLPASQVLFIRTALDQLEQKVVTHQYADAHKIIQEIAQYQVQQCGTALPSPLVTRAEHLYNHISSSRLWAMLCLTIGILCFLYFVITATTRRRPLRGIVVALNVVGATVWAYVTLVVVLRTVISHHLPLTNGFEIMQAIAWFALTMMFFLQRRFNMMLPFGFIVSGLALLVAMMGQSNPTVTSLIPVLNSPLLSIHVMVIMVAYTLLAFIMLNGITALVFSARARMTKEEEAERPQAEAGRTEEAEAGRTAEAEAEAERMRHTSLTMLYPAVFLLTAGIMVGSVWANVSWGRYWGWDAKEVWALITLMVYALPLHSKNLGWFRDARHFHLYVVLAFLAVLMTYFGANYFIPGLHSYA